MSGVASHGQNVSSQEDACSPLFEAVGCLLELIHRLFERRVTAKSHAHSWLCSCLGKACRDVHCITVSTSGGDIVPFDLLLELLLKVAENALPPDLLYLI